MIESGPEGGWLGIGTSAPATDGQGHPNSTSLPIGRGRHDRGGLSSRRPSEDRDRLRPKQRIRKVFQWHPPRRSEKAANFWNQPPSTDDRSPSAQRRSRAHAGHRLAPAACHRQHGGRQRGNDRRQIPRWGHERHLRLRAGVELQRRLLQPDHRDCAALGGCQRVDVRVTGPGGSSEVTLADHYTFPSQRPRTYKRSHADQLARPVKRIPADLQGRSTPRDQRLPRSRPAGGGAAPRNHASAAVAARSPARRSASASTRRPRSILSPTEAPAGGGASPAAAAWPPRAANSSKPRCKRTLAAGSPPNRWPCGSNKVSFQGRLSSARTLQPGSYGVTHRRPRLARPAIRPAVAELHDRPRLAPRSLRMA